MKFDVPNETIDEELFGEFSKLAAMVHTIGKEVLEMRTNPQIKTKDDGSPVTRGDKWSESRLHQFLALHFPHDAILGEEGTDVGGTSKRTWIIDPIDGTIPFKDGDPGFSISIGCEDMGILRFPAYDLTIHALKGKGVYMNGEAVQLPSTKNTLAKARVGFEYSVGALKLAQKARTAAINQACFYEHTCACATDDFRKFVLGHLDAIVLAGASVHDLGAMLTIARELGAVVHGLNGPIDLIDQKDEKIPVIIARNEELLQEMLTLMNKL